MLKAFTNSIFHSQNQASIFSNIISRNANTFTQKDDLPKLWFREAYIFLKDKHNSKYDVQFQKLHTILPLSDRSTAPAPACPGFPLEAPSNSRIQKGCAQLWNGFNMLLSHKLSNQVINLSFQHNFALTTPDNKTIVHIQEKNLQAFLGPAFSLALE